MLSAKGAKLRTCGWFPETEEPVPVIVTRSCYPHQEAEFRIYGEEYAKRGFGFVVQWCRGYEWLRRKLGAEYMGAAGRTGADAISFGSTGSKKHWLLG